MLLLSLLYPLSKLSRVALVRVLCHATTGLLLLFNAARQSAADFKTPGVVWTSTFLLHSVQYMILHFADESLLEQVVDPYSQPQSGCNLFSHTRNHPVLFIFEVNGQSDLYMSLYVGCCSRELPVHLEYSLIETR